MRNALLGCLFAALNISPVTALARDKKPAVTVCTDFIADGAYDREVAATREAEKKMQKNTDILFRQLFQVEDRKQIIWSITEWRNEERHNDTAQSIMKSRRDDRIAAAAFDPYRESFCDEDEPLRIGVASAANRFFIVGQGLIDSRRRTEYLERRQLAVQKHRHRIAWLRVFHNRYHPDEFFFFMGFKSRADYDRARHVGELTLEEVLFTGLNRPGEMGLLAGYNQFPCRPFRP